MENSMIRLLRADEIECRVSTVNEKGVSVLLYKDARVDQKILDEVFGPFGWRRTHQSIDGNLYCTVEIYDRENGIWVAKQDVGTTGYTEKEKSQASDSFKRACFNWGIGRELYSAPFIWVSASKTEIRKSGDRFVCSDRFSVAFIEYNEEREISGLSVKNDSRGSIVYELLPQNKKPAQPAPSGQPAEPQKDTEAQFQNAAASKKPSEKTRKNTMVTKPQMDGLKAELKRTGVTMEDVKDRYKIQNPESMSPDLYKRVMTALAKTKSIGAA